MPIELFNEAAVARAKTELRVMQSNIMVETPDGSQVRAVWEGHRFVDFALGDPIEDVKDFWIEPRFDDFQKAYDRSYQGRPWSEADLGRLPRYPR